MILDKLLEKKDLLAYISWRIRLLGLELAEVPKIENERRREPAKRHIKGRIDELHLLYDIVHRGVKRESMVMCAKFHEKRRKRGLPWEDRK